MNAIRRLTASDADEYRRVRLDALRLHPEAYSSSFEDEVLMTLEQFGARIPGAPGAMLGGFVGEGEAERLMALAGIMTSPARKLRHKATLVSVFVDPAIRGCGLGFAIVSAAITAAHSTEGIETLLLAVTVGNEAARRLYTRFGFQPYGCEPRAIKIGDDVFDEELMFLDLRKASV